MYGRVRVMGGGQVCMYGRGGGMAGVGWGVV